MEKLMGFCVISGIHSTFVWIQGDNSTGEWLMIVKKFLKILPFLQSAEFY